MNDAIACIKKGIPRRKTAARLRGGRREEAWRIKWQDQEERRRIKGSRGRSSAQDPRRNRRSGTAMNHFRPTKEREREKEGEGEGGGEGEKRRENRNAAQHRQNKNAMAVSREWEEDAVEAEEESKEDEQKGRKRERREASRPTSLTRFGPSLAFHGASLDARDSHLARWSTTKLVR